MFLELAQRQIKVSGEENPVLRQVVKTACLGAMPVFGLQKKDRNDDPIEIVANFFVDFLMTKVEEMGIEVRGEEVKGE